MPKLIILVGLVLLIAGGGAGTWWFGIRGEPIPSLQEQTGMGSREAQSEYVELRPISVPIMQEGQVTELLTLVISLEVAGESGLESVASRRPHLRDAMLSELHGLYAFRFVREGGDSMELIKKRLLKRGRQVMGDDLRGVHIQAIQGRDVNSQG